jgi:hypothetical protein
MNNDITSSSPVLSLPMPRWPFFWPMLLIPAYGMNPVFSLARNWHGSMGTRSFSILLLFAALFGGLAISVSALTSNHWRELRVEGECLILKSAIQVPRWARWSWQATAFKNGLLEIPLPQVSLEWVGKTLLLHGHPEMDVRLGRGKSAERIAQWLTTHGFSQPVGR